MKSFPLRELLRRPLNVKKLTAAGQSVQITDNGKPLWVVRSATAKVLRDANDPFVDAELEAMLAEARSEVSASKMILDSRVL